MTNKDNDRRGKERRQEDPPKPHLASPRLGNTLGADEPVVVRRGRESLPKLLRAYLKIHNAFQRSIFQTRITAAVSSAALKNFPRNIPSELGSAFNQLCTRVVPELVKLADLLEQGERGLATGNWRIDGLSDGIPVNPERSAAEAGLKAFAADCLMLFAQNDCDSPATPKSRGAEMQATAMHQAVVMSFAHLDAFLGDSMRIICRARPEVLRTKNQITWASVLQHPSLGALVSELTEQYVYEFGWKTVTERVKSFKKHGLRILIPANDSSLIELYEQRRHLIVHNGGIVTKKYIRASGDNDAIVGQMVPVTFDDIRSVGFVIGALGNAIFDAVASKFLDATTEDLSKKKLVLGRPPHLAPDPPSATESDVGVFSWRRDSQ